MEIKNLERAKELLPKLDVLEQARRMLSEDTSEVIIQDENFYKLHLSKSLKMNLIHIVNCEYERVRKEVSEL